MALTDQSGLLPHWDFDAPASIWDIPFLDEEAKRNILGGNANRLFKVRPEKRAARQAAE